MKTCTDGNRGMDQVSVSGVLRKGIAALKRIGITSLVGTAAVGVYAQGAGGDQGTIEIRGTAGGAERIPIALEGYTGETRSILQFDLEIVGFEVVGAGAADYRLKGKGGEQLQGRLIDSIGEEVVFAKQIGEGDLRSRAHTLANSVVRSVTGQPPIAQTRIAFTVSRKGYSELYAADYDGHDPVQLTDDGSLVTSPAWVPGELIVYYTSYRLDNPDLYVHNLSTGKRRVIARYLGLNTSPAISPDGNRLAMILSKEGSPDVFVGDRNAQALQRLTYTRADESAPVWSPDGERICFVSRARGRAELYWISPSGGEMHRIRTVGVYNATEPAWSPDGDQIAFTTQRGGNFELCIVPANGGKGGEVIALGVNGEDPVWAPNSRTVVFTRNEGRGPGRLALLDVPTGVVKPLPQEVSGSYGEPAWAN